MIWAENEKMRKPDVVLAHLYSSNPSNLDGSEEYKRARRMKKIGEE